MATKIQRTLLLRQIRKLFDPNYNNLTLSDVTLDYIYALIKECQIDRTKISGTSEAINKYVSWLPKMKIGTNEEMWHKLIQKMLKLI